MKDIFVDTNTAQQFCNPLNESYKDLFNWLRDEGVLVYNTKLLVEIGRGNQNLSIMINYLISKGRVNHIKPDQLKKFEFSKAQHKKFKCNSEDRVHLKTVVLSTRKIAIVGDFNGLVKCDGIQPIAVEGPNDIDYKN